MLNHPVTIILVLGLFIIGLMITRWIFSIDTIIKQLKLQNKFLQKIAEKQGVSDDEISEIIGVKIKFRK